METDFVIDPVIEGQLQTRDDGAVAALAARQHGVVARRQLLALGMGPKAVDHRVRCGRLHPLHRGVYAVGHLVVTRQGRWMAAVLSAGPGAVLSHRSAAALWGIRPTASARVELTVPRPLRRRTSILPHCAVLPPDETTTHQGIPITTAARTLLDLAGVLPPSQLDRALNEAEVRRLDGPQELIRRYEGKRGTATFRTLLLNARRSLRSPLEAEFLDFLDANGIERPQTNTLIEGYEVDAVWREARLVVELDGFETHGTRRAFEEDRARDRRLTARGWTTMRVTKRHLTAELASELLSSLGA